MNNLFIALSLTGLFTLSIRAKAQEGIPKTLWPVLKCTDSTLFVTKVIGQNEAKSFVINVVKDTSEY